MNSPIVEYITPERTDNGKAERKEDDDKKLFNISLANVANNSSWDNSDVLFSTPVTLAHILQKRDEYAPFNINPRTVVIDECETCYEDPEDKNLKHLTWILRKFFGKNKVEAGSEEFIKYNERRQFIFVGSTMHEQLV